MWQVIFVKKNKKNTSIHLLKLFQKICRCCPTECLLCARPDARACGDTETNEAFSLSKKYGLIGKQREKT